VSYPPIEHHGVIGDLRTAALVGVDGAIDFMCFPRFDSPSIFASLLDQERGGSFRLAPVLEGSRSRQMSLPDSNVLLPRFLSEGGVAEVSDFMPMAALGHAHDLVRRAKTVKGRVRYRMECSPRFDYGRITPAVDVRDGEALFLPGEGRTPALRLRTPVPFRVREGSVVAEFELGTGESASFVLEEAEEGKESPSASPNYVTDAFQETVDFWRTWIGRSRYQGRWREMVNRSALTLKMLIFEPEGSIVAAPTFGLPETVGEGRNWDYRYVWIRDAAFTLYGLIRLGYTEEAGRFMDWIEARCNELGPDGALRVLYGVDGRHDLTERELPHLEGYRGSVPVRVGNGAAGQLQLDIYGELMDAVYLYNKHGRPISHDLWQNLVRLIDWVCANWSRPDAGIWEMRGEPREFLYSRLMCWVAVDRGVRLAMKRSFPAPLDRWVGVRDAIYRDIFDRFWNPDRQAFVLCSGSTLTDAACLLMPLVRFIGPTDPRWLSTLQAVEEDLVTDSLVYRYREGEKDLDGLRGSEGTFSMCTFWYAECLSRAGRLPKARLTFEKMLGYANHLGLYAEEIGPRGEHLGNFPQAFTHLGLISAAYDLDRRLSGGALLDPPG